MSKGRADALSKVLLTGRIKNSKAVQHLMCSHPRADLGPKIHHVEAFNSTIKTITMFQRSQFLAVQEMYVGQLHTTLL